MDGEETIIQELLKFGQEIMDKYKIYPYVSFVVKNNVIISKGFNRTTVGQELDNGDISQQAEVVATRQALVALEIKELSRCSLYSLMEPTILGFDAALWSGIKRFVWCINKTSVSHRYNKIRYSLLDYLTSHPGEIFIKHGIYEKEALKLIQTAQQNHYYPDNL